MIWRHFPTFLNGSNNVKNSMARFLKRILLIQKSSFQQFVMKFIQKWRVFVSKMAPLNSLHCLKRLKMSGNGARSFANLTNIQKCHLATHICNGAISSFTKWKMSHFYCFWRISKKSVWKIVFSTKTSYYKNGAITNFVLCHPVKSVWKWRQTINSCLEYAKMWVNELHMKWRRFLNNIMQNINFSLIFRWFSSKSAKKLTFSAQWYNEKTAPFSHSSNLSPRKCQQMLLRHVSIPQACPIVIWTNIFEMAPFFGVIAQF